MKTTFNSQSVRNEIFNIETEQNLTKTITTKKIDKGVIGLIAFGITMVIVCVVLSHFGLTSGSNAY